MKGLLRHRDRHRGRQDGDRRAGSRGARAAMAIDVGVAKPVQSGALADDPAGDAHAAAGGWAGASDAPDEVCPYSFAAPLAPLVAARLEGRPVELDVDRRVPSTSSRARHDVLARRGRGRAARAGAARTGRSPTSPAGSAFPLVRRRPRGARHGEPHAAHARGGSAAAGWRSPAVVLNGRRGGTDRAPTRTPS